MSGRPRLSCTSLEISSSCVSAKMTFLHVCLKIPLSGPAFSAVVTLGLCMTDSILLNDLRNFEKMLFIHNWSMEEISIFNASSGKHVSPLVSYTKHNKGLITTRRAYLTINRQLNNSSSAWFPLCTWVIWSHCRNWFGFEMI